MTGKEAQLPDFCLLVYTLSQKIYGISKKHSTKGLMEESFTLNNEKIG